MTEVSTYAEAQIQFQRSYFVKVMLRANGNVTEAARLCGVHRCTLSRLLTSTGCRILLETLDAHNPKRLQNEPSAPRDYQGPRAA